MIITLVLAFIAGILLFNAVPHLVQGITGNRHMTPLSPKSSAAVNVLWAWINLVAGAFLAWLSTFWEWGLYPWIAFAAGGFVLSVSLAVFWSNPDARLPWHKRND